MELLLFLIPVFGAVVLLLLFPLYMVWWEYLIVVGATMLFTILLRLAFVKHKQKDVEYWGDFVHRILHYDDWNELVVVTRTREVAYTDYDGNTRYKTETYQEEEVHYHPDEYFMETELYPNGRRISEYMFDYIAEALDAPEEFVDLCRRYHTIDGDLHIYNWDFTDEHCYPVTWEHSYVNKVMASNSIFNFEKIDKKKAKELGLYKYPEIEFHDQITVLGGGTAADIQAVKLMNAHYGPRYQFRLFVLYFYDQEYNISELQKAYWQGGNKNELVVCLGFSQGKVTWCNAFSWCDEPKLELMTRDYFIQNPTSALSDYVTWLAMRVPQYWKRKEFKDFDYIKTELSPGHYFWLLFLTIAICVGLSVLVVKF